MILFVGPRDNEQAKVIRTSPGARPTKHHGVGRFLHPQQR